MSIEYKIGDSRNLIHNLENESIDCVMTSPPYWGLRDYGHNDQIGLEETPELYLKYLVGLFSDIKTKLKPSGNCFVNLGDTYSRSGSCDDFTDKRVKGRGHIARNEGVPPKSLCMIPERFAWGMIESGWILRNKIIWHKPNHMPESVTDRLTKSYEVIYHFTKSQRYYYDLDAIREPHTTQEKRPSGMTRSQGYNGKYKGNAINPETSGSPRARTQRKSVVLREQNKNINHQDVFGLNTKGKNPGDVWSINTKPYSKAHFAVYPLELVRKPILAGCPVGGTVLDPFGGSGTTAEFCRKNERNCIIFELNPEYETLIQERAMTKTPDITQFFKHEV